MPSTPIGKTLLYWLHQARPNALIPEVGVYCQRSEETHTAPVSCEVGTDKLAVYFSPESRIRGSCPTRPHVTGIAHERHRIREPKEGAESEAHDAIGLREVVLSQWADRDVRLYFAHRCPPFPAPPESAGSVLTCPNDDTSGGLAYRARS